MFTLKVGAMQCNIGNWQRGHFYKGVEFAQERVVTNAFQLITLPSC